MITKDYLKKAFKARDKINEAQERIEQLREDMISVNRPTLSGVHVQTNSSHDPLGDTIARILDKIKECEEIIAFWQGIRMDIEDVINTIEHDVCRMVLRERYVKLKDWDTIAESNAYSKAHVYDLHKKGLAMVKIPTKS